MMPIKRITILSISCFACVASIASAEQPNVIIFFIDDLGYKDLGCYGSSFYQTPAIDELARRSIRFSQFYSASPVCSPTRAALMSGKAPQRIGITQWIPQPNDTHLPHDEFTIAEAFSEAGYETGYIGKWHLGEKDNQLPDSHGFKWMRCVNRAGQPESYFHPFAGRKRDGIGYWDVPDLENAEPGDYLTDCMTDHGLEFIQDNRSKPFFLCFAHYAVHTPIQSPKALTEKYAEKRKSMFGQTNKELADEINNSKTRVRQDDPAYAAMVENLDTNVRRVLDQLDELGLRESTIIVFASDNGGLSTTRRGGPTSVRPLRAGKGWTFEGGIRVPMIVSWPGKLAARETDIPGITMDIYPTLLELAGLKSQPQQHLDGMSLVSAMHGKPSVELKERFLAWTYPHNHGSGHTPSHAIRQGKWKLIHHQDLKRFELFNLEEDVSESKNLIESNPEKAEALAKLLKDWLESTNQSPVKPAKDH
jgi:arylsulfatase A